MWNPFVWTIEVPYGKRQLARMQAARFSRPVLAAVPADVPAAPAVVIAVRVAGATGVTIVPQTAPTTPPAHACCQQCTANHVHAERTAPPLPAPVNAVPAANVTGVPQAAPTTTPSGRQQTTRNHVNTQEPEAKHSRKAAAEEHQHQKSKRVLSAFKSTNTARKVKRVSWAMDSAESSSSPSSTSDQTKKSSLRTPPTSASSASRRAVRDAAKALLDERPNADNDDDSGTDSDDSSAVDTQKIPRSPVYRRGLQNQTPTYQPEESDLESDGAESAIDDSEPPVRRHFTPKHLTNTQQDNTRQNHHSHGSAPQSQDQANNWKLNTSPASFNTSITQPRPQSRQVPRSAQRDSDSDHGSAIDDRAPMHRRPTTSRFQPQSRQVSHSAQGSPNCNYGSAIDDRVPAFRRSTTGGLQTQPRQVAFSAQGDSDSEHGSAIDDRVPKHRRPTNSGPGPQSQHNPRSAQGVSGSSQGSASTNFGPTSRRPQTNRTDSICNPSPFSAPLYSDTADEVVNRVTPKPIRRKWSDPLLDYHNRIAEYRIQDAYRQGQLHPPPPVTPISPAHRPPNTVGKEADCRTNVPQGRGPYSPAEGTRNISPSGTRVQSDPRVEATRRGAPEPSRQDGWHQQFRSSSPSPNREQSKNAKNESNRTTERPPVASEPQSEYRERSKHQRLRSLSPPATHTHSRKYRRSRSSSPSKARLDPIIVIRPKGSPSTMKNKKLVFVYRTKGQKEGMPTGEELRIKRAVRGLQRPPSPVLLSESDSASTRRLKIAGELDFSVNKRPKVSFKSEESKYQAPTVESDSDEFPVRINSAGITWRDV